MSERPYDGSSQDPANTQMFRAFVERGDEDTGRRWVVPVIVFAVLVVIAAVVVYLTLN